MSARRFRSTAITPEGRGHELGITFSDEIAATVTAYQELFDAASGSSVDLEGWGAAALTQIEAVSADLAAEITAMASAAGLSVAALAAVNARTEILAALGARAHECTSVVQLGDARSGRRPVAVQAWDWYASLAESWFVWEIPHPSGHTVTTVTEFGIVGKIGVSTANIALLFNILHHEQDGAGGRIGAPMHVLARAVLDEAADLNQALVRLAGADVSASTSLTLVAARDHETAAVSVELSPAGVGYALPDERGLLVHTNHFISSPASLHDTELRRGPDSIVRRDLVLRALADIERPTEADLLTALDSHLLGGGALCCHVDPSLPPAAQFATLATVAIDLDTATLTAHPGGPCSYPQRDRGTTDRPNSREKESPVLELKRIDNMDILTRDVHTLVDFYHGVLGLPFHLPYVKGEEWAAIDLGNLTLYIFKTEVGEHAPRRTAVNLEDPPGFDSMAFEVADLDAAVSALEGHVEWVAGQITWEHPNGTWYRYRPFFDPDGNMLYVTEPHQSEARR